MLRTYLLPVAEDPQNIPENIPNVELRAGALPEIRLARGSNGLCDLQRELKNARLIAVRVRYTLKQLICICRP